MREILFRGKDTENGQWIYGYYVGGNNHIDTHEICDINDVLMCMVEVNPQTVGQFTGLIDKNGKKIFEGDLIRHYNQSNHPEAYDLYRIEFDVCGCMWVGRYNDNYAAQLRNYLGEHYEVVGNIHDNPELLELTKGE